MPHLSNTSLADADFEGWFRIGSCTPTTRSTHRIIPTRAANQLKHTTNHSPIQNHRKVGISLPRPNQTPWMKRQVAGWERQGDDIFCYRLCIIYVTLNFPQNPVPIGKAEKQTPVASTPSKRSGSGIRRNALAPPPCIIPGRCIASGQRECWAYEKKKREQWARSVVVEFLDE